MLSLFFAWISTIKQGTPFQDVYKIHIFGQIMQSVLCLLILVLIAHLFYETKTKAMISKGWSCFLSIVAIICFIMALILLVISVLFAADFDIAFFMQRYKTIFAVELFGASAGIIVQCLTHTDVYLVV